MKIRDQGIDDSEIAWGMNKNAGPAAAGNDLSIVRRGEAFQNPHGGGPHGDDASLGGFRLVDGAGGFGADFKLFLVHHVIGEDI